MSKKIILLLAALAAGCASAPNEQSVLEKNDAIDDYIHVAELKETDAIRSFSVLSHRVLTQKYIIISAGSDSYLATYIGNCYEMNDHNLKPDIRYESHTLRARSDTYRGCRIQSLHEVDKGQVQELIKLGKGPGEPID